VRQQPHFTLVNWVAQGLSIAALEPHYAH